MQIVLSSEDEQELRHAAACLGPQQAEEGLAENLDPMGGSTFSDKTVRLAFIRKVGASNWTMEKGRVE